MALVFLFAGLLGGPANVLDLKLIEWAAGVRTQAPGLTRFAAGFTNLGGATVTLGLSAIAAIVLLLSARPVAALLLAATVMIERLLVDGLKDWTGRPRPDLEPLLHMPHSLAYPSGHAANSMTAFLAIALLVAPARHRWATAIAALILGFLVGCSRILLGVHWPSDVIGGWTLGMFCVGLALFVGRRSGLLLLEPQHNVVGRHRLAADEQETA